MGKNFKTVKGVFVDDAMYEAPYEYMLKALKTHDDQFDEQKETLDSYNALTDSLKHVDKDKDARNSVLNKYRDLSTDIAEKMDKNPAQYKTYLAEINRAKKDLEGEIKNGSLFEMDRAAKNREKLQADAKIKFDKGLYNGDAYEEAMAKADRDYEGVAAGKGYSDSIHIYDKIDTAQYQEHLKNVITPQIAASTTTIPTAGAYMLQTGKEKKYIDKDLVKEIVTSDPKFKDWQNERLQYMERKLENDLSKRNMTSEEAQKLKEASDIKFTSMSDEFIKNSMKKLGYEQNNDTSIMSADNVELEQARLAQVKAEFDWKRQQADVDENGYVVTMEGDFNNISEDDIKNVVGEIVLPNQMSIDNNPYSKTYKQKIKGGVMSATEIKKAVLEERAGLQLALTKIALNENEFLDKMKTANGRNELVEATGMSSEQLARQANLSPKYKYKSVQSPIQNGNNPKENVAMAKAVTSKFNSLSPDTYVTVRVVDPNKNTVTNQKMTLANAQAKGFIAGQGSVSKAKELVWSEAKSGYVDSSGTGVVQVNNPDYDSKVEGSLEKIPATEAQAKASGKAKYKEVEKTMMAGDLPLMNTTPDMVSESEKVNYGDGQTDPRVYKEYNVQTQRNIGGKIHTVIISAELDIAPVGITKKGTTTQSTRTSTSTKR